MSAGLPAANYHAACIGAETVSIAELATFFNRQKCSAVQLDAILGGWSLLHLQHHQPDWRLVKHELSASWFWLEDAVEQHNGRDPANAINCMEASVRLVHLAAILLYCKGQVSAAFRAHLSSL